MAIDIAGIRAIRASAQAKLDQELAAADAARTSPITTENYLAWNEARHQAWQTYARTLLAIADEVVPA